MTPQIKHPPVIDISHWIEVPDFRLLDPLPWLILTKATQGTWLLDATYAEYADSIREAGIRLGAYHFMEPGDEIEQADWFCEILLTVGLRGDEILACDMEVDGISLEQIRRFLDRVQAKAGIRPLVYSSQIRLEVLYPKGICPEWLTQEWLWIAEYPAAPDLTNEIPAWIVPRGCSKDRVGLWQYTDDGILDGIPGNNIDLNLINPSYAARIDLREPHQGDGPMATRFYKWTATAAHIRSSASAGSTSRGGLVNGDVIQVDDAKAGSWFPFRIAQHADGSFVLLSNGDPLDGNHGLYYATDSYFREVASLPRPLPVPDPEPPPTDPPPTDPPVTIASIRIVNPESVTIVDSTGKETTYDASGNPVP